MNFAEELNKDKVFATLGEVADSLDYECYVVGGWVRDLLLGRRSEDIDVVVVGSGIEMARAVAKKFDNKCSLAVYKNFGTAQVKKGRLELEFVGARKESYHRESRKPIVEDGTLDDDQKRRDFTVNAMAICLNSARYGELVDPFDGLGDLERKLIRTPLDPEITFSDDPLRMMRAVRFATKLEFDIVKETFEAIQRNVDRMEIISGERITEEMNKMMKSSNPSRGLRLMSESGLMAKILPEIEAMKGVEKHGEVGHKDIFEHTLKVLDGVAVKSDDIWLRWAALLHDVGKPRVKQWDDQHGWTFKNHDFIGMKMVKSLFRRLHLPLGEELAFVQKMVEMHMRPMTLCEEGVTDSAIRRLLFDAGDDIDKLMILCESDITSGIRAKVEKFMDNYQIVRQKLVEVEEKDRIRNFQPPVDGVEIMEMFGLEPCHTVGELKNAVKDAILDGIIPNEHDAAKLYVLKLWKERFS